jgi:hypothetical protein
MRVDIIEYVQGLTVFNDVAIIVLGTRFPERG